MSEGPFCTHQTVRLTPHIHEDGSSTDHWRCECGQAFVIPGVEAAATRQTEQELREALEAIRLLAVSLSECVRILRPLVDGDLGCMAGVLAGRGVVERAEALLAEAVAEDD